MPTQPEDAKWVAANLLQHELNEALISVHGKVLLGDKTLLETNLFLQYMFCKPDKLLI